MILAFVPYTCRISVYEMLTQIICVNYQLKNSNPIGFFFQFLFFRIIKPTFLISLESTFIDFGVHLSFFPSTEFKMLHLAKTINFVSSKWKTKSRLKFKNFVRVNLKDWDHNLQKNFFEKIRENKLQIK